MRRSRGTERRRQRLLELALWFNTFWWCRCDYTNIATYRCYHCGARPPRQLRRQLAAQQLCRALASMPAPAPEMEPTPS